MFQLHIFVQCVYVAIQCSIANCGFNDKRFGEQDNDKECNLGSGATLPGGIVTPEPAAMALFAMGGIPLGLSFLRRRKGSNA
jgi:hypothetical protein